MSSIIVCGSMAFDRITQFEGYFKDHILAENIHQLSVSFWVPTMRLDFGGCAGNIAYGLKLLGAEPQIVSSLGLDGAPYLDYLQSKGINTQWIRTLADTYTAQCHITTDLAQSQIAAFHPGAMLYGAQNDVIGKMQADWGIIAPDAKDAMFVHAERMHEKKIPFIFDLGQAMPLFDKDDLLRMIDLAQVITVNAYEAEVLVQRTGRSLEDFSHQSLAVIKTDGAAGTFLYQKGNVTHISAVSVDSDRVLDPTGCGDSYRAGLLYGAAKGWDWVHSCQLASVVAAAKIQTRGPQNYSLQWNEMLPILHSTYTTNFFANEIN